MLLALTALIWGFAFVAQRVGMDYVGPFTFNGVRFALGGLSLLPLIWMTGKQRRRQAINAGTLCRMTLVGVVLFIAATLQQFGVAHTTAGKAGFITGLYVVIVPLMGLLWGQRAGIGIWMGAVAAAVGLYLLSVTGRLTIELGDVLVLIGAFFWAGHVQFIGWLAAELDPLELSLFQFVVCSTLSLVAALFTEPISFVAIGQAAAPILYGGVLSVGVAYTLQVVGQKGAHPAHAAIILSLETVFAMIGGWLILHETLSPRGLVGCALMLSGMLLSQLGARPTAQGVSVRGS